MSSYGATEAPMTLDDDDDSEDHDAGDERREEEPEAPVAKRARVMKPRKPRPKVSLELLKEEKGFVDVFSNFPDAFRKGFKGPGHEVNDLRRLLELYSRWQQRIFPSSNFDHFIAKLEHLSSNWLLKKELRDLRANLISVLLPPDSALDEPGAGPGQSNSPQPVAANGGSAPAGGSHQEGWAGTSRAAGPASAPPPPPPPAQPGPETAHADGRHGRHDEDEDDEYEQMQRQAQQADDDESQWDIAMDAVGGLPDSDDDWQPAGAPPHQAASTVRDAAAGTHGAGGHQRSAAAQPQGQPPAAAAQLEDEGVADGSQRDVPGDEDTQTRHGRRARAMLLQSSDEDDE